ncbi:MULTISPECIES: phage antirepressor KilAC domain-containing protein [Acinetobacter]|uniref:phage antirepressor KilAC domain-containing protein n=1 Tax=Acinetobacter TaxID=469 RepID=UPI0015D9748E|nr:MULTISPECIES: phage antirepressor KilAC domain-containing protein [Acinetobacter]MCU4350236.1 phage regulatory protein/antirepressor Ant [Acinetobacter ursingii]
MNAIVPINIQTMSSLEIAELTGKLHKNVVRDIREMLCKLDGSILSHEQYQELKDSRGYTKEFLLNKNLTLTLMTGYDVNTRHKINVRWQELEAQVAQPIFDISNPYHLLQAIETQAKQNIELTQKVEKLEPKAQALDTIADTTHTYCIRECAKTIGIKEKDLINLLLQKKWCYRDAEKKLQPHAQYMLNGVFTNKASPVIKNQNDGQERVFLHMRVTAFGLTRITGLVNKEKLK